VVALLKYSVLRLAVFVAVLAALAALRLGLVYAVVVAALVSMMLSFLFMGRQRAEVALEIQARLERRQAARAVATPRPDADAAHEDAVLDASAAGEVAAEVADPDAR